MQMSRQAGGAHYNADTLQIMQFDPKATCMLITRYFRGEKKLFTKKFQL